MIKSGFYYLRYRFFKRVFKIIKNKKHGHWIDYWPFMSIKKNKDGFNDVFYGKKKICHLNSITALQNNDNLDFAIVGSGPSIKKLNLNKLQNKRCIFLNGSIMLAKKHNITPFAYIVMDINFIIKRFDLLTSLPAGTNLFFSLGVIRAVAERKLSILQENRVFLIKNPLTPCFLAKKNIDDFPKQSDWMYKLEKIGFSLDFKKGFFDGGTVMSWAIQLAFQFKPKNTYLLGLDISNANEPRFYEEKNCVQKSGLQGDYQLKILPFMKLSNKIFHYYKCQIHNCSPISKLPFDIITYSKEFE